MIGVQLTGNGAPLQFQMKAQQDAFKHGYEELMRTVAISTAHSLLRHSFPAVGNEPWSGNGNSAAAKEQGEYNLRKDINNMFYPLSNHSVKELVGMRNPAVFQLDNPIQWRDESLARAWANQDMDTLFMSFQSLGTYTGENDWLNLENTMFNEVQANKVNYVGIPNEELHKRAMVNGRWDKKTRYAVKNREVITQFIAKKMRDIGKSANGWVDCIRKLGSQVSQALPGKGSGSVKIDRSNGSITYSLDNAHGDPNGMITKSQVLTKVMAEEQLKMNTLFQNLIKRVTAITPNSVARPPALPPPLPPPLPRRP
jgi:hypothetical protein